MVEIERPETSIWKAIKVRGESKKLVELRLVNRTQPQSDTFVELTPSEARCVAFLLFAAAEHPTEVRLALKHNRDGGPLIAKRAPSGQLELRLGKGDYNAHVSLPTTRRIAHALLAESQQLTPPDDAPER